MTLYDDSQRHSGQNQMQFHPQFSRDSEFAEFAVYSAQGQFNPTALAVNHSLEEIFNDLYYPVSEGLKQYT